MHGAQLGTETLVLCHRLVFRCMNMSAAASERVVASYLSGRGVDVTRPLSSELVHVQNLDAPRRGSRGTRCPLVLSLVSLELRENVPRVSWP